MMPFMANESRSAKRRAGARRRVNDEDALEALHALRSELEVRRCLVGAAAEGCAVGGARALGVVMPVSCCWWCLRIG